MLASLVDAPLTDSQLVYEPKYDGIRAIAEIVSGSVTGKKHGPRVRLWSRLGNEKTRQFPEIVAALEKWAGLTKASAVLDGEVVALDSTGRPTGFQHLQGRIHLTDTAPAGSPGSSSPSVAYIVFDLLRDGRRDLRDSPLVKRRAELERVLGTQVVHGDAKQPRAGQKTGSIPVLRLSEISRGDGRALYKRALADGWEGLIAKHVDSRYKSGMRTPDWHKLKLVAEQEFVVGGWTEPRHSRSYFGALLLGVYKSVPKGPQSNDLVYVGHTGTGFDERELARVMKLLKPLETAETPFRARPPTNETPHWVQPTLVVQVKFTEWTADGRLRHPVYLGLRDDKKARDVVREPEGRRGQASGRHLVTTSQHARSVATTGVKTPLVPRRETSHELVAQLRDLEDARRDGTITLPDGDHLDVTNLHKVFWPTQKLTKGALFRYYVQVTAAVLPAVADRPLVMKRLPNGVTGKPFYQHRAPEVPPGVRVEEVGVSEVRPQLIGGDLKTLLYMVQLAAISQDPWFSRVSTLRWADYVALDLDPAPGVSFSQLLDVARWIRDELGDLGVSGIPKTSGADGLHVCIPLPPKTPYDHGLMFCQIIATVVAHKHPKLATIERSVAARGKRVYVDYLQNSLGKTLATAYSARASAYAGVSAPLTWREIDEGVRREEFTIESMPKRIREVGDLWAALRESKGVDLARISSYADRVKRRLD